MKEADWQPMLSDPATQDAAFQQLVATYGPALHKHILRLVTLQADADDVLQNTFIKVYKGLQNFRADSKLYTWLYRIATNESLSWIEQRRRRQTLDIEQEGQWVASQLKAENYFDGDEAQKKLLVALASLPDKQRLVFNLRYFDDMPYQDISDMLGTSVGGLKASYHLAVKKITTQLQNEK